MRLFLFVFLIATSFTSTASANSPPALEPSKLMIEEMTWQEIQAAVKAGETTVIIPTGGTEQTGPHIVAGKHNFILGFTSLMIAQKLGNTLVAPILPVVPEGDVNPPTGNMRFAGTISLKPETFAAVLEDTARSLKQHGFKTICFIGEHGGSQLVQKQVAEKLSAEWKGEHVKVIHVSNYYDEHNGQSTYLASRGEKDPSPQAHGGLADTSEMMAIHKQGVREKLRKAYTSSDWDKLGVEGPSDRASANLGAMLLELKIEGAVKQIQKERAEQ